MWNCLKCGVENEDYFEACRNCSSIAPPPKKPARIKLPPKLGWISVVIGLAVPVQFVVFLTRHYDGFEGVGAFFLTLTVAMVLGSVSALLVLVGLFRGERPSWSHLLGPLLSVSPFLYLYFASLRSDIKVAERNRNAAEQGDAKAQYYLGVKYAFGDGVPKDLVQAGEWYRKAAEQGYADAQAKLDVMYANDEGAPKDLAKAFQWYRKAAERGFARAQLNIGRMYIYGQAVPSDEIEGLSWVNIAAAAGGEYLVAKRAMETHLGSEKTQAAQRRSKEILKEIEAAKAARDSTISVNSLKGLAAPKTFNGLKYLNLSGRPALQNLDGLQTINGLQWLDLTGCTALQNVDELRRLTALQRLDLSGCSALQNLDGLKDLTGLQRLSLSYCREIKNVDVLKGLNGLQSLDLTGSDSIPAAALRELRAALPKTYITFPDGSGNTPQ